MVIEQGFQIATDRQFNEVGNFASPPRAGKVTDVLPSGQVQIETDDPEQPVVTAWPLNGFEYAVGDVVYIAFAVNNAESAIVIGSKSPLPTLDPVVFVPGVVLVDGSVVLTANWDIGEDRRILLEAIRARDGEGILFEDDAGNLGMFIEDATGHVGFGHAVPVVPIHLIGTGTGGGDANGAIIRAENTAAAGLAALHAKNDAGERVQFVTFNSTFAGNTFGLARASKAYLTYNGASGGLYIGTETNVDLGFATNDVIRAIMNGTIALDVVQATVGNAVVRWRSTATNDDPSLSVYQARATTTNATPATLHTFAISASNTVIISVTVIARRTGGSAGTADDGAAYYKRAAYTTKAGTVTLLGTAMDSVDREDVAGWDCTLTISGTNVIVQVTGAANTNITWHMIEGRIAQVGS